MHCFQCDGKKHGPETVAPVAKVLADGIKKCFPFCQAEGHCVILNEFRIVTRVEAEAA